MPLKKIYQSIIKTLRTRISRPQFIMVLATLTGISSGLIAVMLKTIVHYLQRGLERLPGSVESTIHVWKVNPYTRAFIGGILLVTLCFFFPPLFGEGYNSVKVLAGASMDGISKKSAIGFPFGDHTGLIIFAALIVLLKPIAAGITIGSGGNGGDFAP